MKVLEIIYLQLIQNQDFNQELEQKYINNFKEEKIHLFYDFLKTLQDIKKNDKKVDIEEVKKRCSSEDLSVLNFTDLYKWANEVKDKKIKSRLLEALKIFDYYNQDVDMKRNSYS